MHGVKYKFSIPVKSFNRTPRLSRLRIVRNNLRTGDGEVALSVITATYGGNNSKPCLGSQRARPACISVRANLENGCVCKAYVASRQLLSINPIICQTRCLLFPRAVSDIPLAFHSINIITVDSIKDHSSRSGLSVCSTTPAVPVLRRFQHHEPVRSC